MIEKEKLFSSVYWLALSALILALSIYSVLVLFQGGNVSYAIVSATPIIVTSCIILWIGDVTKNVSIPISVSKVIFGSFIAVIISNSALIIVEQLKPTPINLDSCSVLKEQFVKYTSSGKPYLTDLEERPHKEFHLTESGDLIVAFGCKVSNMQINNKQDVELNAQLELMNWNDEVASFNATKPRERVDSWKEKGLVKKLGVEKVTDFFNVSTNEVVYLMIADKVNPSVIRSKGTLELSFKVYDSLSHKYAVYTQKIHIAD